MTKYSVEDGKNFFAHINYVDKDRTMNVHQTMNGNQDIEN